MTTLSRATIAQLAEHLENAELQAFDVTKITDDYPDMDWEDAYDIQWEIRRRKQARGTQVVGLKMGLTSYEKMKQMGVDVPVYAFLADYFNVPDGGTVKTAELIHPKVEAEIAIITSKPLRGPGCTVAHVLAATEAVLPAVEVIDSRYRDFKFDLKSVVADNASSARFVTGGNRQARRPSGHENARRGDGNQRSSRRYRCGCGGVGASGGECGDAGQYAGGTRRRNSGRYLHYDGRDYCCGECESG